MTDIQELYGRLPHSGAMCLINDVGSWDGETIVCTASTHQCSDNPLREGQKLPVWCGLEYAAQAFALHGVLMSDQRGVTSRARPMPAEVFVVSVRELTCYLDDLTDAGESITITARIVFRRKDTAAYDFAIRTQQQCCLKGSVVVMMRPALAVPGDYTDDPDLDQSSDPRISERVPSEHGVCRYGYSDHRGGR